MDVSVVILTYNHSAYISKAIDSVLAQVVNCDWEILIGEDESNDGTRDLCLEYKKKYPDRIRLFLRSRKDVITINNQPTGRFNFIETIKEASGYSR